jgi:hypothetical protein
MAALGVSINEKELPAEPPPCLGTPDSGSTCGSEEPPKRCRLAFSITQQTGPKPVLITGDKLELVQGLGVKSLPSGYGILRCQGIPALKVTGIGSECKPYYDHRIMESIIAMFQIMSATVSLYRSRGEQFDRYGYTAFSLTVLPYAVMSFANLLANLLSMDYPLFHLVSTSEMEEAMGRQASVTAVVGKLTPDYVFGEKMWSIRFEKVDGELHAYKTVGIDETYLGQLGIAETSDAGALETCSIITVPS